MKILNDIALISTFANEQLTYWTIMFAVLFIFLWHKWQYTPFRLSITKTVDTLHASLTDINDTLVKRSISKPNIWNGDLHRLFEDVDNSVKKQASYLQQLMAENKGDKQKTSEAVSKFYLYLIEMRDISYIILQQKGFSSALFHVIKFCDKRLAEYVQPKIEFISHLSACDENENYINSEIEKYSIQCSQFWKDTFIAETRHCELL